MSNNVKTGMLGQNEAERYLTNKAYRIIEKNYRAKTGEIDLIARDGDYIVFIEVKYRNNLQFGLPREAVNAQKQRRIRRTAQHYITVHQIHNQDFRFDVMDILNENGQLQITHITNAFE